jgi:Zn-dependent alcohol dehydrogenases
MNKLDSYTPLGLLAVRRGGGGWGRGRGVQGRPAGRGGRNEYALHAEYNWVPSNLCAAVPKGVPARARRLLTVGAIAMHGVRRAEVQLGDTACVIGLGLVGQLVVRLADSVRGPRHRGST